MNREPDELDPLAAYADGNPEVVRAGAPPEPTEPVWDLARRQIHARLDGQRHSISRARTWSVRVLAAAAAGLVAAIAGAWLAFDHSAPSTQPGVPELASSSPGWLVPLAPAPHQPSTDPLAEFAVLPIASTDDVELRRVPGDGWLPVGTPLLAGPVALATTDEVEVDDPEARWPNVAPAPGFAPMIFAAKPK